MSFSKSSIFSLLFGTLLCAFSGFSTNIGITAWFWPAFFIFYMRRVSSWKTAALLIISLFISFFYQLQEVLSPLMTPFEYILEIFLHSIFIFLPFLLDAFLYQRVPNWQKPFIFPFAFTVIDILQSYGPTGTFFSIAYSQVENLPLLQMLSVTGLYSLTFLITFFNASLNELIIVWQEEGEICASFFFASLSIILILFAGGIRLQFFHSTSPQIATATTSKTINVDPKNTSLSQLLDTNLNLMKSLAIKAHSADAYLLSFGEKAFVIDNSHLRDFYHHAGLIAHHYNLYLLFGVKIIDDNFVPTHNSAVMLNPEGEICFIYNKSKLVPYADKFKSPPSDDTIYHYITEYGHLASVICSDLYFSKFINRRIGISNIDMLIVPAKDWQGIHPQHSKTMIYRAIENGVNLLRTNSCGKTIATDYLGNIIYLADNNLAQRDLGILYLPTSGVTTIYSQIAPILDWSYFIGLLIILISSLIRENT